MKVAIKYCGSCNPQVDLPAIARLVAAAPDVTVAPLDSDDLDAVAILCGCPRACGDVAEVRSHAPRCIVVAGDTLQGKPVKAEEWAFAISAALGEAKARHKPGIIAKGGSC